MPFCVFCGGESEGKYCGNCGKAQPSAPRRRRKLTVTHRVLVFVSILTSLTFLASFIIVRQYVAPFEGPLQVQIINEMGRNSLHVGLYSLTVNGEEVRIPRSGKSVEQPQRWESDSRVELALTSRVAGERNFYFSFVPRERGLLGSDDGETLKIVFKIEQEYFTGSLALSSREGDKSLGSARSPRVNYEKLLTKCTSDGTKELKVELSFATGVYAQYTNAVKQAKLDGARSLTYTAWVSRSVDLQGLVRKIRTSAPLYWTGIGSEHWRDMINSLEDIEDAWSNLATTARAERASSWSQAWDRIYSAEAGLSSAASRVATISNLIREDCIDKLTD